jgi:C4-dicarboxylate-specific signal transduction histidine kinase
MVSGEGERPVLLSVRDRGPGVPEEHLKDIFQPFFRLNRSEGTGEGNGLGLRKAFFFNRDLIWSGWLDELGRF